MLHPRPGPAARLLRINWLLPLLACLLAGIGYIMLRSVSPGPELAEAHALKFLLGLLLLLAIAAVRIESWQLLALPIYLFCLLLLLANTLLAGAGDPAARWMQIAGFRFQPSELAKIGVALAVAAIHAHVLQHNLPRILALLVSLPVILLPAALVYRQPDLGTALLILAGGLVIVFLGGLSLLLVLLAVAAAIGGAILVWQSRGTDWQLLRDYQYQRIDVFLNPDLDPLGAGYNRLQSEIAFGSGGMWGRGYLRGPQTNLDFLPEKHTDFIFAALAEQFGFVGAMGLVALHILVLLVLFRMLVRVRDPFPRLTIAGVMVLFFLYFGVNMWMVVGLFPVVGVPLPLISHGGSAMLTVLIAFGFAESAYASRSREKT